MSSGIVSSAQLDTVDIEDELADFTADLLALRANEYFLKRLFKEPVGSWSNLASFLKGHPPAIQAVEKLQTDCNGIVQVTWLEHPQMAPGYCLILFYVDSLGWNNLAVYNRARLQGQA